jgi:hypothetical protein
VALVPEEDNMEKNDEIFDFINKLDFDEDLESDSIGEKFNELNK